MPIVELASADAVTGVCWVAWEFELGPDVVWTALTDPVWLRRWLGTPQGDLAAGRAVGVGDAVEIDLGGDAATCTVRICEPGRRLLTTWTLPGEPDSLLDAVLAPTASGTRLTLTHGGLAELAPGYAVSWHAHLVYLAGALRGSPLALDRYADVHERVARAYATGRRDV